MSQSCKAWQSVSGTVGTGEAAHRLGITQQAVRDRLRAGTLTGRSEGRAWRVDVASLPTEGTRATPEATLDALVRRLDRIEERLGVLAAVQEAAKESQEALVRERDRHHADAAAAREAALQLTGVTRDAVGASRQLLEALERQADAIAQLVGPGSPGDLLP